METRLSPYLIGDPSSNHERRCVSQRANVCRKGMNSQAEGKLLHKLGSIAFIKHPILEENSEFKTTVFRLKIDLVSNVVIY